MAGWNGSGTFTGETYTWVNDLNAGIPITASRMDTQFSDVTTGINACLAKNGENAATGNLNIGGFRLTSVGNATARTDALPAGQLQDGGAVYIAAAGTNTITASLAPAITAYANGQTFAIKIANTTTAAATLAFNGLSALNMYYSDGTTALVAGALIQNNIYWFTYDSSLNSSAGGFICLNPSRVTGSFTITLTGFTSNPSGTVNYAISQDGKTAFISIRSNITNTGSNATTMTGTGVPSILSAASAGHRMILEGEDNTIVQLCCVGIGLNGTTWTFSLISNSGAWTAAGTKGILTNDAFYTLD